MIRVYIAGPYKGKDNFEKIKNISLAREAAYKLIKLGFYPYCPHTATGFFDLYYPDISDATYINMHLQWLYYCQAVLVLSGWENSQGTLFEIEEANRNGIPIFYSIEDIMKHFAKER